MKYLLTIISCIGALSMSAQVPGYVPMDGLISWHNLDGDAEASFGPYQGALSGTTPAFNRHGEEAMALRFEDGDHVALGSYTELQGSCEFTVSTWFNADASNEGHNMLWCSGLNHWLLNFNSTDNIVIDTGIYCNWQQATGNTLQNDEWYHVVTVLANGLVTVLVNNEIYATLEVNTCMCSHPYTMMLATMDGFPHNFVGSLDEFGTWNRALDNWEIEMLFYAMPPSQGCADQTACNYDPNAVLDDGSCEYVTCLCLDGTIWSEELGGCIPIETCEDDLDGDGVVGVNDLMQVLSSFGTDCPLVEPAEWTCGDPVSYHGYDYETVLIGEQCWFAENSRFIPSVSPASDYSMTEPRCHVYGYTGYTVEEALLTAEYGVYGALYNFQAVQQWGICPTDWHVPSEEDWMGLELTLGIPADSLDVVGYRGCNVGDQLKSESLWNGTNQSGMNMLPGGGTVDSGEFVFLEERGWFWSSTEAPQQASWFRQLESNQNGIYRAHWDQNQEGAKSIRCIKD